MMPTRPNRYEWDEIHNLIVHNSVGCSLVIINLPDAPNPEGHDREEEEAKAISAELNGTIPRGFSTNSLPFSSDGSKAADPDLMDSYIRYMDYVEGIAENLPRVLFVHGAGREVIRFAP
mmetsp:Transcript_28729/g.88048  ORF Transcript_28729/g.88048 Transcript_28729/m.88048 type:complete len:119 (-) Transcript_28729:539-895(-)